MPTFDFTSPDGKTYSIEGPEGATREQAFQVLQAKIAAEKPEPSAVSDVAMQLPTGFNEGLADTAGAPVDAVAWALRKAGLPIPQSAFGGSQSIKNALGLIKANPDNAPAQTTAGKFARSAGSMAAQAVVPEAALAGAARAGVMSPQALSSAQALLGDGSAPARTAAVGAASGVASEGAGQATDGTAAEPYARMLAAIAGGAAASKLAAPKSTLQAMPDVDAVKAEASSLYNDPAVQALRVNGGSVNRLGNNIADTLENKGFFREDHGPVFNAVDRLRNAGQSVSFNELDSVRKALNNHAGQIDAFGRPTPTAAAANSAKGLLDDFVNIDMTNPNNVLTGNGTAARRAIEEARANSGAAIRSQKVSNLLDNAQIDAGAANSGMNVQNRIRQTLKPFLKNGEAKMAGFNDEERAAMNRLVRGSGAMNALRFAGNAIGGSGISILPGAYIGHAALGPAGFALPAAGWALKKTANIITKRQAKGVADQLLARAPIARRIAAQNNTLKAADQAAARHLMLGSALRTSVFGTPQQ